MAVARLDDLDGRSSCRIVVDRKRTRRGVHLCIVGPTLALARSCSRFCRTLASVRIENGIIINFSKSFDRCKSFKRLKILRRGDFELLEFGRGQGWSLSYLDATDSRGGAYERF